MKYYLQAITVNFVTLAGRARRKEFWSFTLISTAIYLGFFFLDLHLGWMLVRESPYPEIPAMQLGKLSTLYLLLVFLPSLAISVRRLHDTGRTGWCVLLNLVPCIGWMILFIMFCQDSQPWDNPYGTNPKRRCRYY